MRIHKSYIENFKTSGYHTMSGPAPEGETPVNITELLAIIGVKAVIVVGTDNRAVIYTELKED